MSLRFDEAKATQVAALFLKMRGGRMSYLKLIKLMYIVDRTALLRWGMSITTDHYVAMSHGPVLSRVYNLIVEECQKPFWSQVISAPLGNYEVELRDPSKDVSTDRMSRAEEKLIEEVFREFGGLGRWELVNRVRTFSEWTDPKGFPSAISIREILKAGGESEDEIRAVIKELYSMSNVQVSLQAAGLQPAG